MQLNSKTVRGIQTGGPGGRIYTESGEELNKSLRIVSAAVPAGVTFKGSISKGRCGFLKSDGREIWRITQGNLPRDHAIGDEIVTGLFIRELDGKFRFLGVCGSRGYYAEI